MAWYVFHQNNSGGGFDEDSEKGLGETLFIEADSADEANDRAESIGVYFDGTDDEEWPIDCPCCGDRWSRTWETLEEAEFAHEIRYNMTREGFAHPKEGEFYRVASAPWPA